jgi:hypothetical protein
MKPPDYARARRKAYEKKRRNWELHPERRHLIKSLKSYYATLDKLSDLEADIDTGTPQRRPKKPSGFCR